ncbi:MAG TPA: hypothetical protein VFQ35_06960 [Polyangiaceae bacterium]|nr:hypothetical protein [Polyangiaceae bacterium]
MDLSTACWFGGISVFVVGLLALWERLKRAAPKGRRPRRLLPR